MGRRFGVTCLYLLLTYEEAADMAANHEEPGPTLIEVPGNNGQVLSKPFSQCSVEDMRKAIQRKRKPASSKPLPPGSVERGEQYHAALKALFPVGTPVQVQVRNIKGKAVVDFKGIPHGARPQAHRGADGRAAPRARGATAVGAGAPPGVSLGD